MPFDPINIPEECIIFGKAADLIRQKGWHQGDFFSETGATCVLGAIYTVCGVHIRNKAAYTTFLSDKVIGMLQDHVGMYPSVWNDIVTKKEVLAALDALSVSTVIYQE